MACSAARLTGVHAGGASCFKGIWICVLLLLLLPQQQLLRLHAQQWGPRSQHAINADQALLRLLQLPDVLPVNAVLRLQARLMLHLLAVLPCLTG
jgi:hypothetical protein